MNMFQASMIKRQAEGEKARKEIAKYEEQYKLTQAAVDAASRARAAQTLADDMQFLLAKFRTMILLATDRLNSPRYDSPEEKEEQAKLLRKELDEFQAYIVRQYVSVISHR